MARMATDHKSPCTHSREPTLVNSPFHISSHNRGASQTSTESHVRLMSGPFQYADELETASDAVLSFYFNSSEPDQCDSSQERVAYKPLLRDIKYSNLDRGFRHGISSVVTCIVEIGRLLFPPSYSLDDEVTRRVQELATFVEEYIGSVVTHLSARFDKSYKAFCRLPSPCATDSTEELALSIAAWSAILEDLHKPTGCEEDIFRQISSIFSSHVYLPCLQLHRTDPDHEIWQLESQFTPISLLLYEAAGISAKTDGFVRSIEEEFELTMSSRPDAPTTSSAGVFGERKRQHNPSKSAPVVLNPVRKPTPRQRENTF